MTIKNYTWGKVKLRKKWTDNKTKTLEEQLIDFIEGVFKFLEYERSRILERVKREEKSINYIKRVQIGKRL